MIYSLTVTNSIGESLTFELSNPWASGYAIKTIDGLGTPDMNVNTTPYGIGDGSVLGSIKAEYRLITIILYPLANPTVEAMRQQLYRYFQIKKPILLSFNTENRLVTIDGYVQKIEPNIFDNPESISIEVKCINPYFHKMMKDQTNFYGVVPQFEFPFSVEILSQIEASTFKSVTTPLRRYQEMYLGDNLLFGYNGFDNVGAYTRDGFTWYSASLPSAGSSVFAYGNGRFIGVEKNRPSSGGQKTLMYSYNGADWYSRNVDMDYYISVLVYGLGKFIGIAGATVIYSEDGLEWSRKEVFSSVVNDAVDNIIYGNGKFIAFGAKTNIGYYSENGEDWRRVSHPELEGNYYWKIGGFGNGIFVLVGSDNSSIAYSHDGLEWGVTKFPISINFHSITYGDGRFVIVGYSTDLAICSKDGASWYVLQLPTKTNWYSVTYFKDEFFFFGNEYLCQSYSFQKEDYDRDLIEFSTYSIDNRSEIEYEGEIDAGLKITIECQTAPGDIVIYNVDTLDYIQIFAERVEAVTGSPLGPRDIVEINTEPGEKYVRLLRNGVYYNILGAMNRGMTWFTLKQGPNKFTYTTSDEHAAIVMSFSYRDTYAAI